ncbi:hypothetical protein JB92DRAFT_3144576 [Gautieria morchelliformis]|nr:hypothetical protein JB92DRAFT_3144576 [Gautieria morchelliformis]
MDRPETRKTLDRLHVERVPSAHAHCQDKGMAPRGELVSLATKGHEVPVHLNSDKPWPINYGNDDYHRSPTAHGRAQAAVDDDRLSLAKLPASDAARPPRPAERRWADHPLQAAVSEDCALLAREEGARGGRCAAVSSRRKLSSGGYRYPYRSVTLAGVNGPQERCLSYPNRDR